LKKTFGLAVMLMSMSSLANAGYLDQVPATPACGVMKDDIDPNMDSSENRTDIEYLFQGTMKQGRNGEQCNTFRSKRSRLKSDSALDLTGISKYSKERVFAWGRLCLLDWCDMINGDGADGTKKTAPPLSDPFDGIAPPSRPAPRSSHTPAPAAQDHGTYEFGLCNDTGIPEIRVALTLFQDPDDDVFTVQGWWTIKYHQCSAWIGRLGKYVNSYVAYHAEGGGYIWWPKGGSTSNYCVTNNYSQFSRRTAKDYTCASNEKIVGFRKIAVKKGTTRISIKR
jgi:uncharacterized membrane protein